jgi:group I intron endonuclease
MRCIYKITCTENNKFYIGSTANKTQRWAKHRRQLRNGTHINKNLQSSWSKYGEDSFIFEVLEEVGTPAELFAAEQKYLDEHAGKDYCFNWSRHADAPMRGRYGPEAPNYGRTFGPEMRAKVSRAVANKNHPNWGKKLTAETRDKIRQANLAYPHKDRKHTPEAIAKIAAASKGRPVSEETRAKRSAALKGREISLEQRLQISKTLSGEGNYWYGKQRSDSFKEKIRKAVIASNPDGEETRYESIQALREYLGLTPPTVNRALKSEKPLVRGPFKGWKFRYDVV